MPASIDKRAVVELVLVVALISDPPSQRSAVSGS